MRGSFVYPIRTPLGRMGNVFASIRPTDLAAHLKTAVNGDQSRPRA